MEKNQRLTADLINELVDGIPYAQVLEGARDQVAVRVGSEGGAGRVIVFGVSEAEPPAPVAEDGAIE